MDETVQDDGQVDVTIVSDIDVQPIKLNREKEKNELILDALFQEIGNLTKKILK